MLAKDLMSSPVVTISAGETVGAAARMMLDFDVSALPVLDESDNLVGILSHTDFGLHPRFRPLANNLYTLLGATTAPQHIEDVSRRVSGKLVQEVMRRQVITVQKDAEISAVTELMIRNHIHRIPVMDGKRLLGIITRHDFLKLIAPDQ